MLTEERHQAIITLLEKQGIIKMSELLKQLDASESTVRRDLQDLEDQGLLVRIHGGAKKSQRLGFEPNMQEKKQQHLTEKKEIGKYAANLIQQADVIYLDAGTTTLEMIPFISTDKQIQVVTNSVNHAARLIDRQIDTIILGGQIKLSTNAVRGATACQQLQEFNFNKCFMGMNGVHLNAGFTTPDPEEAFLKKIAFNSSQQTFVLVDHSKFQQATFAKVAPLKAAEILTDFCESEYKDAFQAQTKIKEVSL